MYPVIGTDAACSNVTLVGFVTNTDSECTHTRQMPAAGAEHVVAWFELRYVPANRFNLASHIATGSGAFSASPGIDGSAYADQDVIVSRRRLSISTHLKTSF